MCGTGLFGTSPSIRGCCTLATKVFIAAVALIVTSSSSVGAQSPHPHQHFFELGDLPLESGVVLHGARLAYATYGTLDSARANAILVPSAYGSTHHGYDFLLGAGMALDTARYFVVLTELFGNGVSSSPSNTPAPHDGARFPLVSIRDNVTAGRRLMTEHLAVRRVRAVIGHSMGAQQALQWAVSHPEFMDTVVAVCGTARTYPHGVVRLESAISALTADAAFAAGEYTGIPMAGIRAWALHWTAWVFSQEWWREELYKPNFASPEALIEFVTRSFMASDPNNLISQVRTWQRHDVGSTPGYDGSLEAALRSIRARVLYMPCETDLYFPIGDFLYEARHIPNVAVVAIPSKSGHMAGAGWSEGDRSFLNRTIDDFLRR